MPTLSSPPNQASVDSILARWFLDVWRAITIKSGATYADSGAIAEKEGIILLTKAGVAAMTLTAPAATTDDRKELTIISTTAQAHTLTQSSPGFNNGGAASDVGTFGGAIGDNIVLVAYQGVWYVKSKVNVTLA